jgi:hypothetical protein
LPTLAEGRRTALEMRAPLRIVAAEEHGLVSVPLQTSRPPATTA